jgi:predicted transcriptional regulator
MRLVELLKLVDPSQKQPSPLTCGQTVENAARRMERHGARLLPICRKDGSVAGVLSERDIVVKVVARSRAPELCTVDEVMNTEFVTCTTEDSVDDLRQLLEASAAECALILTRAGELVGVVDAAALAGRPALGRPARLRPGIGGAPDWGLPRSRTLG